jgi:hypothetical protein
VKAKTSGVQQTENKIIFSANFGAFCSTFLHGQLYSAIFLCSQVGPERQFVFIIGRERTHKTLSLFSIIKSDFWRLRRPKSVQQTRIYIINVQQLRNSILASHLKHKHSKALIYKSRYFWSKSLCKLHSAEVIYCAQFITAKYFRETTGERPTAARSCARCRKLARCSEPVYCNEPLLPRRFSNLRHAFTK